MPWCHGLHFSVPLIPAEAFELGVTPPKRNTSWNFKEDQLVLCSETPPTQKHEPMNHSTLWFDFSSTFPRETFQELLGAVGVNLDNLGYMKSIEIPYNYGEIYVKSKPQKLWFHRIKNSENLSALLAGTMYLAKIVPGQAVEAGQSWSAGRGMKHVQTNVPIYPLVY